MRIAFPFFAFAAVAGCAPASPPLAASRPTPAVSVEGAAEPSASAPSATAEQAPAEKAPPAATPKTVPEIIGDKLAGEWCMRGGTGFGAFGTENALPSCSAIHVFIEQAAKAGDIESAVIVLVPKNSFSEEERYLFLRRGDEIAVFFLVRGFSSGVGGFSHEIEITKLESKHAWAASVASGWHDSDMGLCAETGGDAEDIVVCTHDAAGFGCIQVPTARTDYAWSTMKKDGECGETKVKDVRTGFAMTAKVDGDSLEVRADKRASFTKATVAPFAGRAPISRLLHQLPAKRVPLKT